MSEINEPDRLVLNDSLRDGLMDILVILNHMNENSKTQFLRQNPEIASAISQLITTHVEPILEPQLFTRRENLQLPDLLRLDDLSERFGYEYVRSALEIDGPSTEQGTASTSNAECVILDYVWERKARESEKNYSAYATVQSLMLNPNPDDAVPIEVDDDNDDPPGGTDEDMKDQSDSLSSFVDEFVDSLDLPILAIDLSEHYRRKYVMSSTEDRFQMKRWTEQHLRLPQTMFDEQDEGSVLASALFSAIFDFANVDDGSQTEVVALVQRLLDDETQYWSFRLEFIMDSLNR